jgi:hypothetical protein
MELFSKVVRFTLLLSLGLLAQQGAADTIYCKNGKQMHCLGFDEKVVERKALCFDPLQCSQAGFVCKSELDELESEHNELLRQHNELADTHNTLIGALESSNADYERLQRCVARATTLEEAQGCS